MVEHGASTGVTSPKKVNWINILLWTCTVLIYAFLALPVIVVVLSAFSPTPFPQFPPTHVSIKWFLAVLNNSEWMDAFRISLILLVIVTPVTVILGTLAAYGISRLEFRGRQVIQALMLSPLMMPEITLGIMLLYAFTLFGFVGTIWALVIGHTLVAFPYVVRTVSVSLAGLDRTLEDASMNLGAGPVVTFRQVTLPLMRPGIIAGAVFASVTSFGEVSVSLLVNGPQTITIPVRIYNYIQQTFDPSVNAVSVIFVVLAIGTLVVIERRFGLTRVL
ncbi:ABC transporter permease [Alicyclobacillus kakegawensis]|uniref:ABC transporter permease n=1 Tax=Alicyclobacillus kakegawensis TaxID=392012 RepID=UPI0008360998|nr:ABC transporter permease [Alicyclobacillus kakegawensis]